MNWKPMNGGSNQGNMITFVCTLKAADDWLIPAFQ